MPNIPPALAGFNLFPIRSGDKTPALSYGWQTRATNDNSQLAEWDAGMPGLNWAVAAGTSGLFIFDIDPSGVPAWEALLARDPALKSAVDRAYKVKTPRGGFHVYFQGQGPTTASAIAQGIDTRGGYVDEKTGKWKSLGYVVVPGSKTVAGPKTVDGEYTELGGELFPMPPAVLQIVPEKKSGTVVGLERSPDLDQPRNVQWATDLLTNYVKEGRVSVEGHGGNNLAFQVAASVLDKAISPARCFELMDELWNPHCSPPWEDWELETLVGNAHRHGEDTAGGSKGFQDNASAFEKFAGKDFGADEPSAPTEKRKRFTPMLLSEARKEVRPASWLVPGFIPSEGTGILYGLSGSYKTFMALDWALCLAHGIPGQWGTPPVKHKVLFLAGESAYALQQERVDSWSECHGVSADDAEFAIVRGVPPYADKEGWEEVRDGLLELSFMPEFVVVDTLTRVMAGMDENSNNDAKLVLKLLEELSAHYGCFVLATGHTGKNEANGIRGAQVFQDNCDAVHHLKATKTGTSLKVKKLKEVDIPDETFYFDKKEFGKSIVLRRTEKPGAALEDEKSSKTSWSAPDEIAARLVKLGGRCGHIVFCQEISSELGIDQKKVQSELGRRQDIQWLREDKDWRIPTCEQEFDL